MTNEEYHKYRALNSSSLELLSVPARYKYALDHPEERSTDYFSVGSALHTLVLEPDDFARRYAVSPKFDRRTKDGKEGAALFEVENAGKMFLTEDDYATAKFMAESIMEHKKASELLRGGIAEKTILWQEITEFMGNETTVCHFCQNPIPVKGLAQGEIVTCPSCGKEVLFSSVLCKCRPDFLGDGYFLDIKTTSKTADEHKFRYSIRDYNYHLQAEFYRMGISQQHGDCENYWIVVEKEPPYLVAIYQPGDNVMLEAKNKIKHYLRTYRKCTDTGVWPGFEEPRIINF